MKKILIISPHFPPSNLTAVHRARFFANHLPENGWEPVILMVHEKYYEEGPDLNLEKMLPPFLRVEKVSAMKLTKPRLIGDIGLRAFRSMYRRAKQLIKEEQIDFVYITIPSFYGALWGRWLHQSTGIAYGIDYIDPWVHEFPGSNKLFSRHWMATQVAKFLEPIAVKKVSLITGVAASYYEGVLERNPHLVKKAKYVAIPYGSEKTDHEKVRQLNIQPYLFQKKDNKIQLVYAGAMLPKAYTLLEKVFTAIKSNKEIFSNLEIHFIGTGKTPTDPDGYNIREMAIQYGLWEEQVFEYPKRIPYLDVLVHLDAANGVFILGSTEPHYTPSKVYQAVLSEKPVLALLHRQSTGVEVLKQSHAGMVIDFETTEEIESIDKNFPGLYHQYLEFAKTFEPSKIDITAFDKYSAANITYLLAETLNSIV